MALTLDGQDALQRGRSDTQPLGHGNVILHGLGDGMTAHHQHMRTAEQIAAHIDAAFVFLGNRIVEEQGQIERGANRGKARVIDGSALLGRLFGHFMGIAAPCGGDIGKGPFHKEYLHFKVSFTGDGSTFFPRPFPVLEKGAALEDIPPSRLREWHSRGQP